MKKMNKKGFTIVELVIVIAVIAILAAVLIPTFSGVVEKANQSAALSAAKNAYTEYLADDASHVTESENAELVIKTTNYYYTVSEGQLSTTAVADKTTWGTTAYKAEVVGSDVSNYYVVTKVSGKSVASTDYYTLSDGKYTKDTNITAADVDLGDTHYTIATSKATGKAVKDTLYCSLADSVYSAVTVTYPEAEVAASTQKVDGVTYTFYGTFEGASVYVKK